MSNMKKGAGNDTEPLVLINGGADGTCFIVTTIKQIIKGKYEA